jgi:hypothetical protein
VSDWRSGRLGRLVLYAFLAAGEHADFTGLSHIRAEFYINLESLYGMEVNLNTDRECGRAWRPDGTRACDAVHLASVALGA